MRHGLILAFCTLFLLAGFNVHGAIRLVEDGKPVAEIVIAEGADQVVQYAGKEFQKWIKEISGAVLPIVSTPGNADNQLLLAVNPDGYPDDLQALKENDGYAVRTRGNAVTLFGSRPKGVLNGVYRLLYRNTDIIWARPNPVFGTCFTPSSNVVFLHTDYLDVPTMVVRGWHSGLDMDMENWQIANGSNWTSFSMGHADECAAKGLVSEYGGGHNLCGLYMREEKYYADHPEYYSLRNGRRMKPSDARHSTQLCFTNPQMTQAFLKELDEHIKNHPTFDMYRVLIEDNYELCECDECLKPILLADGTLLMSDDKTFRSTQFYLWLNVIAKHVKETCGKGVFTYAYFFTEIPPKCAVEDNIHVCYCPIYKNSKLGITASGNQKVKTMLDDWLKLTKNITWRDYYGLCRPFPRPIDTVAAEDLRYCLDHGVIRTYTEMYSDMRGVKSDSWDVNSMYFWILAQLVWNPRQDVNALRSEFLERVYGAAAKDVAEFYSIVEKSWNTLPGVSKWNDKPRGNWQYYVVRPKLGDACKAAIARAQAAVDRPKGKIMLERLAKCVEESVKPANIVPFSSKFVSAPPPFDPGFKAEPWGKTEMTDNFLIDNGQQQKYRTEVRVLHDDANFYIGFKCDAPRIKKDPKPRKDAPRDSWYQINEKCELFLTGLDKNGKNAVYQIVFTSFGSIYDSMNGDKEWNGSFDLQIKKFDRSWSALVTIPYSTLGYKEKPKNILTTFLRYSNDDGKKATPGFWNDCTPHVISTFTELEMK
ncbi:MAG: DUF4838 domain-containing protein [Victivallales bacterium]|nr:DUF4838 domain-containing protein [Victivallales bacterium]